MSYKMMYFDLLSDVIHEGNQYIIFEWYHAFTYTQYDIFKSILQKNIRRGVRIGRG